MGLRLYNTLARQKQEFVPLSPPEVRVYVCGVTAYDLSHVGHARSALVFDVIRRHLLFKGYRVWFVKNFTDIDDKIIRRAREEGASPGEVAERYIEEYRKDMLALGVQEADVEPKATDHVKQMIGIIQRLVAKGIAYTRDGDVYYEVRRFPRYGSLSGKNVDELLAGARVEVDERKRHPLDFALWKAAKEDEPSWESPWGAGRPGWHIECSAMSMHYLGESFDIHGGGEDLIFPHHENEIAQSEATTGKPFVRYWLHNGFVNLGAEKMSKSQGNILTIKELMSRHEPDALRLYLLGTHYRHPLEFSEPKIVEAGKALERFRNLFEEADRLGLQEAETPEADTSVIDEVAAHRRRFEAAMDDDFNTPQGLGVLFDLARTLRTFRTEGGSKSRGPFLRGVAELESLGTVMGLFRSRPRPSAALDPALRARIEALVRARSQARARNDWAEADRLRQTLSRLDVVLEDTREGTVWKVRS